MKCTQLLLATLAHLALAAPQQKPSASLPFIEANTGAVCFPGEFEKCMGTKLYCETKAWKRKDEPKQYASSEACLADHFPPATSNPTTVKPDTAAKQCIVKFVVGIDDDNEREISAPPIPCSRYRKTLCDLDRQHDATDGCGQCEEQCKGI